MKNVQYLFVIHWYHIGTIRIVKEIFYFFLNKIQFEKLNE